VCGSGRRVDGLSLAELRGLKWEDIASDRNQLSVVRTVWHREIIETKTQRRAATLHLLPNVVAELKRHRTANPMTAWVFEGPRVFPLELATLGRRSSRKCRKARASSGVASTHSAVVSLRGCTTTGRQSKPLVRFSVMAPGQWVRSDVEALRGS
jgi:integrase